MRTLRNDLKCQRAKIANLAVFAYQFSNIHNYMALIILFIIKRPLEVDKNNGKLGRERTEQHPKLEKLEAQSNIDVFRQWANKRLIEDTTNPFY